MVAEVRKLCFFKSYFTIKLKFQFPEFEYPSQNKSKIYRDIFYAAITHLL